MLQGWIQIAVFCAMIVAAVPLLGGYMARVFTGERVLLTPVLAPVERLLYRILRVDPQRSQGWKSYAGTLIVFSALFWLLLYLILRTQTIHPWNPEGFHSGTWDLSFNTASSFLTNTNWQFYGGETTLSYFSQMAGLAVQNFISAAVGIVVVIALIRGIANRRSGEQGLGVFFVDLTRAVLYVLLPIAIVATILLISQGALQTLGGSVHFTSLNGTDSKLAVGPVASQEAIKMLGTNGGGFFNVNSAMPFENPSQLANWIEMFLILCIPASLTYTYGRMVGSRRQGWSIFTAMAILFVVSVVIVYVAESDVTPAQHLAGLHGVGNMEGKEVRFGIANSSLFTAITTVVSCGAVNSAFESLTGIGGLVPMINLSYSESVFGGVGTGLYTMLLYVLLAVFIGGLMVGRTPEYLGKKIEAREIKLVSVAVIFTPLIVLFFTGLALATKYGAPSIYASGPQGFSQTLYAYMSQANNNGSAWAGYTGYLQPVAGNVGAHGVTFADLMGGFSMLLGRYIPIVLVLAVAGTLVRKKVAPAGLGTLRTDTPTFVGMNIFVVVLIGALTFFPALLLGPVVQGLTNQLF
ncbi:Potassium-transporting ATPase potassium-binding subunit [Capillimicrobium parvum]|uniref:Potassium-transporting ATPase potassium-binding subunit n=2 Tax=Capillimicrobium parvum TaxID=2884022 RepID=A0A9E7C2H8_9ACTN|nr:potassium-transporting ATPase subunit KdpA [Capillimicrobium parvum]UGS38461.1 Potassium-transporting ATPase potassium-binding subunit [Capillimicrobium parvum]